MCDEPFALPPSAPMTPERAREAGRAYKALAVYFTDLGVPSEARRNERDSQQWLDYAITLAQTPPKA